MSLETHPCFSSGCTEYARIHLPVAPSCNLKCNYCLRKYSCANENRPGVVAKLMSPEEARAWYLEMKQRLPKLTVAGIAGPGDALANWQEVKKTLELIRQVDKEVFFCLSTNGLYLSQYADELKALGVDYITVTLNAVNVETAAKIYEYIQIDGKTYKGEEAAAILLRRQLEGLAKLQELGVKVKINTVAIPGINFEEIEAIARLAADYGCVLHNILPIIPVAGTPFGSCLPPVCEEMSVLRCRCEQYIPQMRHCNRCRADAAGTLK